MTLHDLGLMVLLLSPGWWSQFSCCLHLQQGWVSRTRPDGRGSNYLEIIAAAKAKALQTLDDPEPKLTKLELAFVTNSLTNDFLRRVSFHTRYHLSTPPETDDQVTKATWTEPGEVWGAYKPSNGLKWSKSGDLSAHDMLSLYTIYTLRSISNTCNL